MSEPPEYIQRAEEVLWDWGTHSPVDCMQQSKDKFTERKLEIFNAELQYHMGAFFAAQLICNSLYKIEGFDRYYDKHHPPWMSEAIEYKQNLKIKLKKQ